MNRLKIRFLLGGTAMLNNIGDVLICKDTVNSRCLEMSNLDFDIKSGDRYKVTDKDDFPDDHHCHWYELTSEKDVMPSDSPSIESNASVTLSFNPSVFALKLRLNCHSPNICWRSGYIDLK